MTEFFVCAFDKTIGIEGTYSKNPDDLGGETWKGISRNNYPDWDGWRIIDQYKANVVFKNHLSKVLSVNTELLTLVRSFYYHEFWMPLNLDKITLYQIAEEIFEAAVNQGKKTAARYFQQALNLLNNNQKHYSNIDDDGSIGKNTIKALDAYMLTANFPGRSKERNLKTLLKIMNGLQFERYVKICRNSENQEIFVYGWMNRV